MENISTLPMAEAVLCFSHIGTRHGKVTAEQCYNEIMTRWHAFNDSWSLEEKMHIMLDNGYLQDGATYTMENVIVKRLISLFTENDKLSTVYRNETIEYTINLMSYKDRLMRSSPLGQDQIIAKMENWCCDDEDEDDYIYLPDNYRPLFLQNLTTIAIPDYMEFIPDFFFAGFSGVEEIKVREGIRGIGINAFARCTSLKKVQLPASLKILSPIAFVGCEDLYYITMNGGDE